MSPATAPTSLSSIKRMQGIIATILLTSLLLDPSSCFFFSAFRPRTRTPAQRPTARPAPPTSSASPSFTSSSFVALSSSLSSNDSASFNQSSNVDYNNENDTSSYNNTTDPSEWIDYYFGNDNTNSSNLTSFSSTSLSNFTNVDYSSNKTYFYDDYNETATDLDSNAYGFNYSDSNTTENAYNNNTYSTKKSIYEILKSLLDFDYSNDTDDGMYEINKNYFNNGDNASGTTISNSGNNYDLTTLSYESTNVPNNTDNITNNDNSHNYSDYDGFNTENNEEDDTTNNESTSASDSNNNNSNETGTDVKYYNYEYFERPSDKSSTVKMESSYDFQFENNSSTNLQQTSQPPLLLEAQDVQSSPPGQLTYDQALPPSSSSSSPLESPSSSSSSPSPPPLPPVIDKVLPQSDTTCTSLFNCYHSRHFSVSLISVLIVVTVSVILCIIFMTVKFVTQLDFKKIFKKKHRYRRLNDEDADL